MRAKVTIGPALIAFVTELFRQVKHNGYRQAVILTSQGQQGLTGLGFNAGGINDGQFTCGKAFGGDKVQYRKCIAAGTLVVLIVGDQAATKVRREHFCWLEVPAREGRFARA